MAEPVKVQTFFCGFLNNCYVYNSMKNYAINSKFGTELNIMMVNKIQYKKMCWHKYFWQNSAQDGEKREIATRPPLGNWGQERKGLWEKFLCSLNLYLILNYCTKFQVIWTSGSDFMAIWIFKILAFLAVTAESAAAEAVIFKFLDFFFEIHLKG